MFSDVSVSFNYDYDIVAVSNYIPFRSVDIMVVCLKLPGSFFTITKENQPGYGKLGSDPGL